TARSRSRSSSPSSTRSSAAPAAEPPAESQAHRTSGSVDARRVLDSLQSRGASHVPDASGASRGALVPAAEPGRACEGADPETFVREPPMRTPSRSSLALAADLPLPEALELYRRVEPWMGWAKVGLSLFVEHGPAAVEAFRAQGA